MPATENAHPAASVTEILGRDHRQLDATLADAKRSLAAGDLARGATLFAAFRDGLERHIVVEEDVIFPAFEKLTGVTSGPTEVMRMEHTEIRKLMADIARHLEGGDPDHVTPMAALTARLYAHNGKEERILYPATDRAASAAGTLEALVGQIEL